MGDYVLKGHGHETVFSLFDLNWLRKGHLYTFRNVLDIRTKSRSRSPRIVYYRESQLRKLNISLVANSNCRLLEESVTLYISFTWRVGDSTDHLLQRVRDSTNSLLGESVTPHIITAKSQ